MSATSCWIVGTIVFFAGGTAALAADTADVRVPSLVVGGVGLLGVLTSIPFLVFSQTTLRFD